MIQFFQLYYAWKNEIIFYTWKNICSYIMYNIVFHTSEYIGRYFFISMPANSNINKIHKVKYNGHVITSL